MGSPKTLLTLFSVSAALAMTCSTSAHALVTSDDFIFTPTAGLGAGVTIGSTPEDQLPEAVVRVETNFCKSVTESMCISFMRGKATGALGQYGLDKLDVDYDVIGGEFDINGDKSLVLGSSLFNTTIERNVAINDQYFIRLSFVGFRGRGAIEATKDLELFAQASIDILGYGLAEGVAQGRQIEGFTQSGKIEIGALIAKRVSVSLSERAGFITGNQSVQTENGAETCATIVGPSGATVTQSCSIGTQNVARDTMWSSVTGLSGRVRITKNVALFIEATYSYFHLSDLLGGASAPTSPPIPPGQTNSSTTPTSLPTAINSGSSEFTATMGVEARF